MNKYILVSFAFMGVAFYELSGGDEFEPGENSLQVWADPEAQQEQPASSSDASVVARADTDLSRLPEISFARSTGANLVQPDKLQPALVEEANGSAVPAALVTKASASTARATPQAFAANPTPTFTPVKVSAAPEPVIADEPQEEPDIRFVSGDVVNLRGGPGTGFEVVAQLRREAAVEVLEDNGEGWLRLRVRGEDTEGWMADWLVTAAN